MTRATTWQDLSRTLAPSRHLYTDTACQGRTRARSPNTRGGQAGRQPSCDSLAVGFSVALQQLRPPAVPVAPVHALQDRQALLPRRVEALALAVPAHRFINQSKAKQRRRNGTEKASKRRSQNATSRGKSKPKKQTNESIRGKAWLPPAPSSRGDLSRESPQISFAPEYSHSQPFWRSG